MNITDLINTFGYPAAITVGMAYFLKYIFDKNSKLTDEILEVVENNTKALTKFSEKLDGELNEEKNSN